MLAAALYYASCFVWQIDVSGNENISASDILGALESEGFEAGTYYPGLDTALLANQILAKFPELSFFAVNLHGSRAEVIVREYTPAPEMIDENSPCDITASESGTILKLRVFEGSPAAAAGDRVVRGQTLIYGKGVHALGEAEAEVIREKTIAMPLKYYAKVYSGEELRQNYVKFGNLRLNLYFGTGNYPGKCDILVSEKRLKLFSFELPFVRGQIRASFYERGERTLTAARAAAALRARFDAELDNLPAGVAVIDVSYKASRKDGMVMMTQTLRTHQQIGTENGN
jgi:similar to stage IV sporulation protein